MKAIILAAGRGERMRPLTDHTPKPLLEVRGKRLIEWHIEALARAGVRELVVNTAWLEDQFPAVLGDGSRYGVSIRYSMEGRDHGGALETAGGIAKALPLLGDSFWVVSGDVFLHHPGGDFGIDAQGFAVTQADERFTWASVGLFRAGLVDGVTPGAKAPLRPSLDTAIRARRITAQRWDGGWTDVGTIERLNALNC